MSAIEGIRKIAAAASDGFAVIATADDGTPPRLVFVNAPLAQWLGADPAILEGQDASMMFADPFALVRIIEEGQGEAVPMAGPSATPLRADVAVLSLDGVAMEQPGVLGGEALLVLVIKAHRDDLDRRAQDGERRFRLAVEATGDGLWEQDLRSGAMWLSPRWKAQLGYQDAEIENSPDVWARFLVLSDVTGARVPGRLPDDPAEPGADTIIRRYRHRSGRTLYMRTRFATEHDALGRPVRLVGADSDITDQVEAFAEIEEQNRLWGLAEEVAQIGFWHENTATGVVRWSEQIHGILGLDPETAVPNVESILDSLHPGDRGWSRRALSEAVAQRETFEFEARIIRPDGSIRQCLIKGRAIPGMDGATTNVLGIIQDITDRKQVETDLRDRNRLLELAELVAEIGHWRIHFPTRSVTWSNELFRIHGLSPTDFSPDFDNTFAIIHPEDRARVEGIVNDAMREGSDFEFEYRVVLPDGTERRVHSRGYIEPDSHGLPIGAFAVVQDVTERKRVEAQLLATKEAAETAARAKSNFLANMSHELRTPMTGVLGLADMLLETDLGPDQRGYVETLRGSANTLLTILNDVLDFSKIEAGRLRLEGENFDLRAALDGVIRILSLQATGKGLGLTLDLPADVPAEVHGDPARLQQVLYNLLGNAIKFTERGAVRLGVVDWREQPGGEIRLTFEVTDTGIGMSAETIAVLFQPFSQADASTSRRFGGTGLGLSICRRLVELMGGEIGVRSRLGEGTTFWFTVTLRRARDRIVATRATKATVAQARPLEILVVDDNEVNSLILRAGLERLRHRVDVVENGEQAVRAVQQNRYDLVFMDMQMPIMDGETATRAIRALGPAKAQVAVVALTADAIPEHRERYALAGLDEILIKPIDWTRVRAVLERVAAQVAQG